MTTFKIGDRVRVAEKYRKDWPSDIGTGTVEDGYGPHLRVRWDGWISVSLYSPEVSAELELAPPATPADERAALVEASERAAIEADIALVSAKKAHRALVAYDEAHRTPTFAEKVAGLGIGAVLQSDPDGAILVRTRPGWWAQEMGTVGVNWRNGEVTDRGSWRILSEGVRVPAADEGVE